MAAPLVCLGALMFGGAAALSVSQTPGSQNPAVVETYSNLPKDAPDWCKNESNLTWAQRKERMLQHATLEWAKKQVKELRASNQSVPDWMEKMVADDENRGRMKWAMEETKHLKADNKEVPQWMVELVLESQKWANRWAACKAAALKAEGREVPEWMAENGRKGIIEYASQKAEEIQEEINQLEEERTKEESLIQADGDVSAAEQRMLAQTRVVQARSLGQQLPVLQQALQELEQAQEDLRIGGGAASRVRKAMANVRDASGAFKMILSQRAAKLGGDM